MFRIRDTSSGCVSFLLSLPSLSRGQEVDGFEYRSQNDYLVDRDTGIAAKKRETPKGLPFFIQL